MMRYEREGRVGVHLAPHVVVVAVVGVQVVDVARATYKSFSQSCIG